MDIIEEMYNQILLYQLDKIETLINNNWEYVTDKETDEIVRIFLDLDDFDV